MELVTGRAGSPHITAQQDRQLHQGIWGEDAYILNTGNMLEPQVQSSNKILIKDGALMYQGALFSVKVGTTDEITINNGNQGMKRKDLVVARYTYDSEQNVESAVWLVYQGTPTGSNPVLPSGISGDIQAGDAVVDVPYLSVSLDGINIVSVDVIPEVAPDIPTINASLSEKEPVQKKANSGCYYKNGYDCFLHAADEAATDVIKTLSAAYRPKKAATISGWCYNDNSTGWYPCIGGIRADGTWAYVSAINELGQSAPYYIYNPSQSVDRRSYFRLWMTGAWTTNVNGA